MVVQQDNCASPPAKRPSWLDALTTITAADFAPAKVSPSKPWHRVPVVAANSRLGLRTIWKRVARIPQQQDGSKYATGLLELAADGKGQRKRCRGARHVPTWQDTRWLHGHDRAADNVQSGIQEAKDAIAAFHSSTKPFLDPPPSRTITSQSLFPDDTLRFVPRKRNSTRMPLEPAARTDSPDEETYISQAPVLEPSPDVHITERSKRRLSQRLSDLPAMRNSGSESRSSPPKSTRRRATLSAFAPPIFFSPSKEAIIPTILRYESPTCLLPGFTIRATPSEVSVEESTTTDKKQHGDLSTPNSKVATECAPNTRTSSTASTVPIVVFCQPTQSFEEHPDYETRRRVRLHSRRHSMAFDSEPTTPAIVPNKRGRRHTLQPVSARGRSGMSVFGETKTKSCDEAVDSDKVWSFPASHRASVDDRTSCASTTIPAVVVEPPNPETADVEVKAPTTMPQPSTEDIVIGDEQDEIGYAASPTTCPISLEICDESPRHSPVWDGAAPKPRSEDITGVYEPDFDVLSLGSDTAPPPNAFREDSDNDNQNSTDDTVHDITPVRILDVMTNSTPPFLSFAAAQHHTSDVFATPTRHSRVIRHIDTPIHGPSVLTEDMQLDSKGGPAELSINDFPEDEDATLIITVDAEELVGDRQSIHDDSDTEMLRKFVTRVKADKSAKAAAAAAASTRGKNLCVHKRRSGSIGSAVSSGSPVSKKDSLDITPPARRLPLGSKDRNVSPSPSPTKKRKDHGDIFGKHSKDLLSKPALEDTTPPRPKRHRKKMEVDTGGLFNPEFMPNQTQDTPESSGPRRSKRKCNQASLKPTATSANSALSLIPVRLPGSLSMNGDENYGLGGTTLSLHRNMGKDLAAVTRVNTRKNKGNADPASVVLALWATNGEQTSMLDASADEDDRSKKESKKRKKTTQQRKVVRWAKVLARTQESDSIYAARRTNTGEGTDQQTSSQTPSTTPVSCLAGGTASLLMEKTPETAVTAKARPETDSPPAASSTVDPEKKSIPRRTTRASRIQPPTPISKLPSVGMAGAVPVPSSVSSAPVPRMATRRTKILSMSGNGTPAPKKRATKIISQ